jgi:hypothetical protein
MRDIATGRVGPGTLFDLATMLLPGSWSQGDELLDAAWVGRRGEGDFSFRGFSVSQAGKSTGVGVGEVFVRYPNTPYTEGWARRVVLRYGDYEAGIWVNSSGNMVAVASSGDQGYVSLNEALRAQNKGWTDDEVNREAYRIWQSIRGGRFIHNHPHGTSFSWPDLRTARGLELSEMIAIGPNATYDGIYRYSLSPTARGWTHSEDQLKELYDEVETIVRANFESQLAQAGIPSSQRNSYWDTYESNYMQHDIFALLNQRGLINYSRERIVQ